MSTTDVIFGSAKILVIIVTFFVAVFIWTSFNSVVTTHLTPTLTNESQAKMNSTTSNITVGINTIDYMMPIIVFGLLIVSLIFAFKSGANVVYAVLSIVMWIFALILSAILTNTYLQVDSTLNLGSTMVISDFIMTNLKWIVLGWSALLGIVMFSRNKQEANDYAASERVFGG